MSSPEQAEDQNDEVQAEAEEEDTNQAAGEVAEELESNGGDSGGPLLSPDGDASTGHESTSATVTVDRGTGASSSNNTGSVYDLPDTQWSDEDWEIWADVLRCSGKNKGQKRRLEMFRRFKYLRQQGQWVGTTPNDHVKSARMSARPKSSGGKPE